MISYSQRTVFTTRELAFLRKATEIVDRLPVAPKEWPEIRCHEVARVVGEILYLEVEDGHFGTVDHSWLWTSPVIHGRGRWPNILDVYAVGSLPMVQLVDMGAMLPHNIAYRPGEARKITRTDIRQDVLAWLRESIDRPPQVCT